MKSDVMSAQCITPRRPLFSPLRHLRDLKVAAPSRKLIDCLCQRAELGKECICSFVFTFLLFRYLNLHDAIPSHTHCCLRQTESHIRAVAYDLTTSRTLSSEVRRLHYKDNNKDVLRRRARAEYHLHNDADQLADLHYCTTANAYTSSECITSRDSVPYHYSHNRIIYTHSFNSMESLGTSDQQWERIL
jgi:hypothetical protein